MAKITKEQYKILDEFKEHMWLEVEKMIENKTYAIAKIPLVYISAIDAFIDDREGTDTYFKSHIAYEDRANQLIKERKMMK